MGKTHTLYSAVLPWNATNNKLQYSSSDPSVVTVDATISRTAGMAGRCQTEYRGGRRRRSHV
ncbi:Ig-like domain-containing protein [Paenibacillus sp. IHBB 3054]|uniref:Ig-like domain-containing protein n=1 Tax=Paenibacillus sp. IHBB 3054 TaxID=3425689 RepID=UPI003F678270